MAARPQRVAARLRRLIAAGVLAVAVGVALAASVIASGCAGDAGSTLRLVYAGSVIIPFDHLARAFEEQHPGVRVFTESHGSIQCIRQVTEIRRRFDLLVSADYALVPPMMYEVEDPDTGRPYAEWQVRFATNRLVLAYSSSSQGADEITAQNWYDIIVRPGVRFGIADPRFDAAGYRSLMVLQLAERFYEDPLIVENVAMNGLSTPVTTSQEGDVSVIEVPELLATQKDGGLVMRGSSVQLLPLLATGDVDYALEYESVALQHGLRYLELPRQIDMSDVSWEDWYKSVVVRIDMQRFKSVKPEFAGEVIGYGMTIPTNAPEPSLAEEFVAFVLGREGRRILLDDHQPLIVPPVAQRAERMPAALEDLVAIP